ncbi:MAG: phage holin family protein [Clostridia bacterium]|nr:phage holin family protein [Clostridia bacterium]
MSKEVKQGRVFITFLCCIMAMVTLPYLLPGVNAAETGASIAAGTLLGLAYLILRPAMRLLTLPIGCLTLGLFNLVIDVGLIWGCGQLIDGFTVAGVMDAVLSAVLVNSLCAIVGGFR